MTLKEDINVSIEHWTNLRDEANKRSRYERDLGNEGTANVWRNKAESYERAAESLRLERQTGAPHCSCCLKPTGVKS